MSLTNVLRKFLMILARYSKFVAMIKAARHVPTTYQTPSNKNVGGKLLVENYNDYMSDMTAKLLIDVADFGLTVFGDCATIVKCPLTNILFAGEIFCVMCCLFCCCWQFHKTFLLLMF